MEKQIFSGQEVYFSEGALGEFVTSLAKQNIQSMLLVRGNASYNNVSKEIDQQIRSGKEVHEIKVSQPTLQLEWLKHVYSECKNKQHDMIIAIGGGKVLDTAKMITYFSVQDNLPALPIIAIPTTAGSGSEATPFAVVYEADKKISIEHNAMLPSRVIIDPLLTKDLSCQQRAISGIDAWCQSIESIWSNRATEDSMIIAEAAYKKVIAALPAALENETSPVSLQLMLGAYHAGRAIRFTYTTGAHALSYYLTAKFRIPHGQAVAVFLPVMLRYNLDDNEQPKGVEHVQSLLGNASKEDAIRSAIDFIRKCGLKATLRELNLPGLEAKDLIASINRQRFSNNPRVFDHDALLECIEWSSKN